MTHDFSPPSRAENRDISNEDQRDEPMGETVPPDNSENGISLGETNTEPATVESGDKQTTTDPPTTTVETTTPANTEPTMTASGEPTTLITEPHKTPAPSPPQAPPATNEPDDPKGKVGACDLRDNGIFEFMTPEMAIELYQRLHSNKGLPDLEWKFYGRRKPNDPSEADDNSNQYDNVDGGSSRDQAKQETSGAELNNTEFDFDESFSELQAETSAISDSLQLKRRPEPGSERKANLSDIMSDILKETSITETE